MTHKGTVCFLLFLSFFFQEFLIVKVLATPFWLTEGFYAKYSIYKTAFCLVNFLSPYDCRFDEENTVIDANGTFFWKVLKIKGDVALIEINFSVVGFQLTSGPDWKKVMLTKSFKIMVNISDRFILNTTRSDPLYLPYWIPLGIKENDEIFLGHQYLMNFWYVGTFLGYGMSDYVVTSWKTFRASDIIFAYFTNISGVRVINPRVHIPPDFDAIYDRGSGIMIGLIEQDPVLLKFLNIFTLSNITSPPPFGFMLDNIGVEPVKEENNQYEQSTSISLSVLTVLIPTNVEAGKEFEVSLTLENNGTSEAKDLRMLLGSFNEGVELPSPIQVDSIRPRETKEVKLRIRLLHEGTYNLYCEVQRDDEVLLRKSFSIECKPSLIQTIMPFMIIIIVCFIIFILGFFLLKKRHR